MDNKLHLYTGPGKGKTTAAMGLALRCAGHGFPVLIAQFMKNGQSGELAVLGQLPCVTIVPMPRMAKFSFQMTPQEKEEAALAMNEAAGTLAEQILLQKPRMVILDELAVALHNGFVSVEAGQALIHASLTAGETVVTGRGAPQWLQEQCDYVSVIQCEKHPFITEKLQAREGIEW